MIDTKEIRLIALANVSDPTTEYFYRYVCRWYSKTFHTPLHVVLTELPVSDVMLAYFEEGYEAMDEEDRDLEMMKAIDPDFDVKEEESIQDFIEMVEAEEDEKRLAKRLAKEEQQKQSLNQNNREQQSSPVVRKFEDETSEEDGDGLDNIDDIKKL